MDPLLQSEESKLTVDSSSSGAGMMAGLGLGLGAALSQETTMTSVSEEQ